MNSRNHAFFLLAVVEQARQTHPQAMYWPRKRRVDAGDIAAATYTMFNSARNRHTAPHPSPKHPPKHRIDMLQMIPKIEKLLELRV